MNSLLLKNRPQGLSEDDFKVMWSASGNVLEALYKTIQELTPPLRIKIEDFGLPQHYGLMVWQQAQQDLANKIIDLLPSEIK